MSVSQKYEIQYILYLAICSVHFMTYLKDMSRPTKRKPFVRTSVRKTYQAIISLHLDLTTLLYCQLKLTSLIKVSVDSTTCSDMHSSSLALTPLFIFDDDLKANSVVQQRDRFGINTSTFILSDISYFFNAAVSVPINMDSCTSSKNGDE